MGCRTSIAKAAQLQTKSKKQIKDDMCQIPYKKSSKHISGIKKKSSLQTIDSAKMLPADLGL